LAIPANKKNEIKANSTHQSHSVKWGCRCASLQIFIFLQDRLNLGLPQTVIGDNPVYETLVVVKGSYSSHIGFQSSQGGPADIVSIARPEKEGFDAETWNVDVSVRLRSRQFLQVRSKFLMSDPVSIGKFLANAPLLKVGNDESTMLSEKNVNISKKYRR
jgi:hypothetical protein